MDWRSFLIGMAVASLLAFGLHEWVHLGFWVCFGFVVFAILVNGLIAMFEDDF